MKLGSLQSSTSRDGELIIVNRELTRGVTVPQIAKTALQALENWSEVKPKLEDVYLRLNDGDVSESFPVEDEKLHSALPRTFLFADGSAFIQHIKLVRQARNAELPETLTTVPLMYQGEGSFITPRADIPQVDEAHGTDFEGEVAVITTDVPMGVSAQDALDKIALVVIMNDVSLRGLIPEELKQGFGFFQSKPQSALSPFALTIDELGQAWDKGRVNLPLRVQYKGEEFGQANAKEMHFHFGELIAHAAKTRPLPAGCVIGSGTVANEDSSVGSSCLAEKRMLEKINAGEIKTPFMKDGDTVQIEMLSESGENLFGSIFQRVKKIK